MVYRSSNKTVYSAKYHVIWCPRYRRRVLVGPVEDRLREIIAQVVLEVGGEVIEVEVMPDQVHLVVEVPPAVALSSWSRCSRAGHRECCGGSSLTSCDRFCGRRHGSSPRWAALRWRS
ncbi:MAG: REP-associated tyrosine transposase [Acidimicrobiaceae bacterium]|nr:REP-associated tyrosine transposase [Acidimicrobiaceae bacterium]